MSAIFGSLTAPLFSHCEQAHSSFISTTLSKLRHGSKKEGGAEGIYENKDLQLLAAIPDITARLNLPFLLARLR